MRTRLILAAACLMALANLATAAAPLAERLPAGCPVYVGWAGKTLAFDGSMVGQLLSEQAVKDIVETARQAILDKIPQGSPVRAAVSEGLTALMTAAAHPAALALIDAKVDQGRPVVAAALLVDLGADKDAFDKSLQAVLQSLGLDSQLQPAAVGTVSYKSLTVGGMLVVSLGYVGNTFFLALGEDTVKTLIEVDPKKSLATDKAFADAFKTVDSQTVQSAYFADVPRLIEIGQSLLAGLAPDRADAARAQIEKVIGALGLGKLKAIVGATSVVDRGMLSKTRIISPAPHKGLLMLAAGGTLTPEDLAGVPADADLCIAFKFSPKAAYDELVSVVGQIDPQAQARMVEQIETAGRALDIQVPDTLAAFGDTWTFVSAPSLGGFLTGSVLTVDVKDAAKASAFMGKIEGIVRAAAMAQGGFMARPKVKVDTMPAAKGEIRYLSFAGEVPVAPAWTVQNNKLYIAAWPQVVQAAIAAPAAGLAKDEAFVKSRSRLSPQLGAMCYVNTPKIIRQVYGLPLVGWTVAASQFGHEGIPARPDWLPALPTLERYLRPEISGVSSDAEGITIESFGSIPLDCLPFSSSLAGVALFGMTARAVAPGPVMNHPSIVEPAPMPIQP